MLISLISNLLTFIVNAFITLIQFLIVVVLGLVSAVLFALPWALRAAAIAVWLVAMYMGISSIQDIYSPFTELIPLLALQFALIVVAVGWMIYLMISNTKYFWGGLFAGGFVIGAAATGINWLTTNWVYANLAFRALPPALVGILSLSQMIRMRAMRQSGQVESHDASILFGRR